MDGNRSPVSGRERVVGAKQAGWSSRPSPRLGDPGSEGGEASGRLARARTGLRARGMVESPRGRGERGWAEERAGQRS